MNKLVLVLVSLALSGTALAGPSTFAEFALINGGENGRNGSGKENGFEFAGAWAFNENWYIGGVLGEYDRRNQAENTYFNANGGYVHDLSPKTSLNLEGGLWYGEQKNTNGYKAKPTAIEAKAGLNTMITDKFGLFGTFSLVGGDLDAENGDDDLNNFIWSLGGAYSFSDRISLNVKLVNGSNGVNGQDEVLRIAGRWTF
jgi:hypothetical protein